MSTTSETKTVNGINVTQLFDTIEMIKSTPQIAEFKFRATNAWQKGTHNRATVKDFYGALQEDDSREAVSNDIDEPPILLGNNKGLNPVEYLLVGLSGCLTTAMVAHAAARGIPLHSVSCRLEGDLDVQGFLGLSDDIPVGYKQIRVFFKIDADLTTEEKKELVAMAKRYSPVANTIFNAVPVDVGLDQ